MPNALLLTCHKSNFPIHPDPILITLNQSGFTYGPRLTADELRPTPQTPQPPDPPPLPVLDAADFLTAELQAGPVLARTLFRSAHDAGHAIPTLRRAKLHLGVRAIRIGKPYRQSPWFWSLAGSEIPENPPAIPVKQENPIR